MKTDSRLRIAIQKKGRLNNDSMDLLYRCGLQVKTTKSTLLCHAENLPIDLLFVRDDDIPTLVMDGVCDLGIIGENTLQEQTYARTEKQHELPFDVEKKLGFGRCRLSIALPNERSFESVKSLDGSRIVTSYPNLLRNFLERNQVAAKIMTISGSVEVAPRLGMADAICDLVSTGRTLEENNLKEVLQVTQSQAVLIKSSDSFNREKKETYDLLLRRIEGVLCAQESKYIMFHAPKIALDSIKKLLPGSETPTIMPLEGIEDKVAVHVVSREGVFWDTIERLKHAGASSLLVLPIEKMMA